MTTTQHTIQNGDRVEVTHELGTELGTVVSTGPNNSRITVRFDDRTRESFSRSQVRPA